MIKPRHKRLFKTIKSHPKAKLVPRCNRAIAPSVGDFIDVVVDALNPVQVLAVGMGDTEWLKKEFGK